MAAFLTDVELKSTYYPQAANVDAKDLKVYLQRANAFCKGEIGGDPPVIDGDLKTAVAMAFEIFAEGETAQVDEVTGNITEAAPTGYYPSKAKDPLDTVRNMLRPYRLAFEAANAAKSDRGVMFI